MNSALTHHAFVVAKAFAAQAGMPDIIPTIKAVDKNKITFLMADNHSSTQIILDTSNEGDQPDVCLYGQAFEPWEQALDTFRKYYYGKGIDKAIAGKKYLAGPKLLKVLFEAVKKL